MNSGVRLKQSLQDLPRAALADRVAGHFAASAELKRAAAAELAVPIAQAIELMAAALRAGGKIMA